MTAGIILMKIMLKGFWKQTKELRVDNRGMKSTANIHFSDLLNGSIVFHLTGICAAGKTPIWLAPVLKFSARRLLPSTFPKDSGNPNSSPTEKPFISGEKNVLKKKV